MKSVPERQDIMIQLCDELTDVESNRSVEILTPAFDRIAIVKMFKNTNTRLARTPAN